MELDPIMAVEDSGLPMMMPAADKNSSNNPIEGKTAPSSSSIPRDEDPVTAVLGSGSATTNIKSSAPEKPAAASAAAGPSTPTRSASSVEASNSTEDLSTTLSNLLLSNTIPRSTISALQQILRENATLKEKNSKLKSLLGRSAKAQRDAKQELEQLKKRYEEISRTNERLEHRIEVLANRPTHMDLLADFETNFDRALLAIGTSNKEQKKNSQSGGEDAAERRGSLEDEEDEAITAAAAEAAANSLYEEMNRSATSNTSMYNNRRLSSSANSNNNSTLLLAELTEAKSRITHLESLNTTLQTRCTHLEHTHNALFNEHTHTKNQITNLQLELRMSKMETEHAQRSLREKEAMVQEMQLEINLVTNSAVEANKRAAEGLEVAQSVKMDKEYVDGLEAKVVALQDWALASTESKQLMSERCRGLEGRVKELTAMVELLQKQRSISQRKNSGEGEGGCGGEEEGMICLEDGTTLEDLKVPLKKVGSSGSSLASTTGAAAGGERILWTKSSSLVVGAGMVGQAFLELGSVQIESYETVTLRWKFDLTRDEEDIYFSILKGICEEKRKQRNADACFRNRHVKGGGGGDVSGAFAVQNACTLVWSNEMSWFRPKTIKWTVEAVAIEWTD
jgi:hypothetical protein